MRSLFLDRVNLDIQDLELVDNRPYFLLHLHVTNCSLSAIKGNLLRKVPLLKYLNLSYNELSSLSCGVFQQLNNVEVIDLSQNQLAELHLGVFNGTSNIRSIILNNNYFHSIASCTFGVLKHLQVLLSEDRLTLFGDNVLCGRLNVGNNPLSSVDKRALMQSDSHLAVLDTTPVHLCCFLPNVKSCSPRKTFFISSCRNLISGFSTGFLALFFQLTPSFL